MRGIQNLIILLCVVAALGAFAQQPLKMSQSAVAIRIIDPVKQVQTFSPLIEMIDGIILAVNARQKAGHPRASVELASLMKQFQLAPGIDAKGTHWILIMPTPKEEDKKTETPVYAVVSLADPGKFMDAMLMAKNAGAVVPPYKVFGKNALVSLRGPLPAYTDLQFDFTMHTTRPLAAYAQFTDLTATAQDVPLPFDVSVITGGFAEMGANIKSGEIGIIMDGDTLLAETFIDPIKDSKLERALGAEKPDQYVLDYARLLPKDLAYAGINGPRLEGAPSISTVMMKTGVGLLTMLMGFFGGDDGEKINTSMDKLINAAGYGRALGLIAPATDSEQPPTIVAIYRTPDSAAAKQAVHDIITTSTAWVKKFADEMGEDGLSITGNIAGERIENVNIDRLTLTLPVEMMPNMPEPGKDAPEPAAPPVIDYRFAYLGDKMLLTVGPDGLEQMRELIKRTQNPRGGFNESARYRKVMENIPDGVRGFESYASLDITHALLNQFMTGKKKTEALDWLQIFPPQRAPITTYQKVCDGTLYGEIRLPAQQLDFLYSMAIIAVKQAPEPAAILPMPPIP